MIRAAIIGLGRWGRSLVTSVQGKSDDIRFVSAHTRTRASAEEFCRDKGVPLADNYEQILADPDVDAVVLATPHTQHEQQVLQAAAAGKHIHVEKPITLDRASTDVAVAAVRKAGLVRTSRNRNSALHSLTGLGFALLRSRDLVAGPFRPIRSTTGDNTMSVNPFDDPDGAYLVLVNDQGQHSLWPSFAQVPAGWRVALAETDRQTALDHITANWTDMRPKSLIDSMNAEVA